MPISATGKQFEKVILRIAQRHIEKDNVQSACHFYSRARHSTTVQCIRRTDHVTLNISDNLSMAEVSLNIKKAFGTTWHPGLLYKVSELDFSSTLIKLIS
jgi:hypothetical protein